LFLSPKLFFLFKSAALLRRCFSKICGVVYVNDVQSKISSVPEISLSNPEKAFIVQTTNAFSFFGGKLGQTDFQLLFELKISRVACAVAERDQ
jgi:hypothetical protein